jgi:signal peptidase II
VIHTYAWEPKTLKKIKLRYNSHLLPLEPMLKANRIHAMSIFASIAFLVLAISQTSSHLVNTHLAINETYVVNSFIYFTHIRNLGGTFGVFQGMGWLVAILSAGVLLSIIIFLAQSKNVKLYEYALLGCIVGAGASNILDRIIYGGVIDFINIQHIPYWNYIFNIADVMIHVGIWPIVVFTLFKKLQPYAKVQ